MADTGLVSAFITKMRQFTKDLPVLTRDKFDGDGSTVAFRTNHKPILEDSYTVKIGGSTKTENTHYTLDLDTGVIEFTSGNEPASGNGNVTIDYKYIQLRDAEWLQVLKNTMEYLREKIWEDKVDESTFDVVANQDDYDLDSISSDILSVVDVWMKTSSANVWASVDSQGINVRYWKEQNILNFNPPLAPSSTYDLRIRFLEAYKQITATTDTFEPDTKYHSPIIYISAAEYFDRLIADRVQVVAAVSKEQTFEPLRDLVSIANNYRKIGEQLLRRIKNPKPAMKIPIIVNHKKS